MPLSFPVTVLLNAASGGAGPDEATIQTRFLAAGIEAEIVVLQSGQDPGDAARLALDRAQIVVAAGGDGTVSGVAGALAGTSRVLGVLPVGTLNHFAKDLKIPLDLEGAVATIAGGRVASVDVGQVHDRVFVNNASIGVYPSIVETREELRRAGHGKWPAMLLAMVRMLRSYRGVLVRMTVDGKEAQWRTPFVFVGNNAYTVEGLRLGSRRAVDGGRLFAYLAPRIHAYQLPLLAIRALLGLSAVSEDFEIVSAADLRVDAPHHRDIALALDGELTRMTTPLDFRTWAGALRVLVPPV